MLTASSHFLAQGADAPIPVSTDWAPVLLLTIVWIFVAAALTGACRRYFRPKSHNP